jgi:hypothetical protein
VQTDTAGASVGPGTCGVLTSGCLAENDAGFFESTFPLACTAQLEGTDASTTPSTPSGDDDGGSGCSMSPGALSNPMSLATPFGLGLALALRRRRRRGATG